MSFIDTLGKSLSGTIRGLGSAVTSVLGAAQPILTAASPIAAELGAAYAAKKLGIMGGSSISAYDASYDPYAYQVPTYSGASMANVIPTSLALPSIGAIGALATGAGSLLRRLPGAVGTGVLGYEAGQALGLWGGSDLSSPFTPAGSPKLHMVSSPRTGGPIWFRPAGRPVLFSGDLAACRRVRKVAGRARRRVGGR